MDDALHNLELQIENLLKSRKQLKQEIMSLRHQLTSATQEKATLLEQNQSASEQIRRIIIQLKEEVNAE